MSGRPKLQRSRSIASLFQRMNTMRSSAVSNNSASDAFEDSWLECLVACTPYQDYDMNLGFIALFYDEDGNLIESVSENHTVYKPFADKERVAYFENATTEAKRICINTTALPRDCSVIVVGFGMLDPDSTKCLDWAYNLGVAIRNDGENLYSVQRIDPSQTEHVRACAKCVVLRQNGNWTLWPLVRFFSPAEPLDPSLEDPLLHWLRPAFEKYVEFLMGVTPVDPYPPRSLIRNNNSKWGRGAGDKNKNQMADADDDDDNFSGKASENSEMSAAPERIFTPSILVPEKTIDHNGVRRKSVALVQSNKDFNLGELKGSQLQSELNNLTPPKQTRPSANENKIVQPTTPYSSNNNNLTTSIEQPSLPNLNNSSNSIKNNSNNVNFPPQTTSARNNVNVNNINANANSSIPNAPQRQSMTHFSPVNGPGIPQLISERTNSVVSPQTPPISNQSFALKESGETFASSNFVPASSLPPNRAQQSPPIIVEREKNLASNSISPPNTFQFNSPPVIAATAQQSAVPTNHLNPPSPPVAQRTASNSMVVPNETAPINTSPNAQLVSYSTNRLPARNTLAGLTAVARESFVTTEIAARGAGYDWVSDPASLRNLMRFAGEGDALWDGGDNLAARDALAGMIMNGDGQPKVDLVRKMTSALEKRIVGLLKEREEISQSKDATVAQLSTKLDKVAFEADNRARKAASIIENEQKNRLELDKQVNELTKKVKLVEEAKENANKEKATLERDKKSLESDRDTTLSKLKSELGFLESTLMEEQKLKDELAKEVENKDSLMKQMKTSTDERAAKMTSDIKKLKDEYTAEKAVWEVESLAKQAATQQKEEDLKAQNQELKKKYEKELELFSQKHNDDLERLRQLKDDSFEISSKNHAVEMETLRRKLFESMELLNLEKSERAKLESANSVHATRVEALEKRVQTTIEEVKASAEIEKSSLRDQLKDALGALDREKQTVESLKSSFDSAALAERQARREILENLESKFDSELKSKAETIRNLETSLLKEKETSRTERMKFESEIDNVTKRARDETSDLKSEHHTQLSDLRREAESRVLKIKTEHEDALKKTTNEAVSTLEQLRQQTESKEKRQETEHQLQISRLTAEWKEEINNLKRQNTSLQKLKDEENTNAQSALRKEVAKITDEYIAKFESLKKEAADAKKEQEDQMRRMKLTYLATTESMKADSDRVIRDTQLLHEKDLERMDADHKKLLQSFETALSQQRQEHSSNLAIASQKHDDTIRLLQNEIIAKAREADQKVLEAIGRGDERVAAVRKEFEDTVNLLKSEKEALASSTATDHATVLDQLRREYKSMNDRATESAANQLKAMTDQHSDFIASMKSNHGDELKDMKSGFEERLKTLKNNLESEMEYQRSEHANLMHSTRLHAEREITELKQQLGDTRSDLVLETNNLKRTLDSSLQVERAQHERDFFDMKKTLESKLADSENRRVREVNEVKRMLEDELRDLQEGSAHHIAKLKFEREQNVDSLLEEIGNLKVANAHLAADLKEAQQEKSASILSHEKNLQNERIALDKERNALSSAVKTDIESLIKMHQDALEEERLKHRDAILNQQKLSSSSIEKMKVAFDEHFETTSAAYETALEMNRKQYELLIEQLKSQHANSLKRSRDGNEAELHHAHQHIKSLQMSMVSQAQTAVVNSRGDYNNNSNTMMKSSPPNLASSTTHNKNVHNSITTQSHFQSEENLHKGNDYKAPASVNRPSSPTSPSGTQSVLLRASAEAAAINNITSSVATNKFKRGGVHIEPTLGPIFAVTDEGAAMSPTMSPTRQVSPLSADLTPPDLQATRFDGLHGLSSTPISPSRHTLNRGQITHMRPARGVGRPTSASPSAIRLDRSASPLDRSATIDSSAILQIQKEHDLKVQKSAFAAVQAVADARKMARQLMEKLAVSMEEQSNNNTSNVVDVSVTGLMHRADGTSDMKPTFQLSQSPGLAQVSKPSMEIKETEVFLSNIAIQKYKNDRKRELYGAANPTTNTTTEAESTHVVSPSSNSFFLRGIGASPENSQSPTNIHQEISGLAAPSPTGVTSSASSTSHQNPAQSKPVSQIHIGSVKKNPKGYLGSSQQDIGGRSSSNYRHVPPIPSSSSPSNNNNSNHVVWGKNPSSSAYGFLNYGKDETTLPADGNGKYQCSHGPTSTFSSPLYHRNMQQNNR